MNRLFLAVLLLALTFAVPAFSQQRWERTYGGAGDERGYSVQQTSDTGYIVAGWATSFGNASEVYLIKTDPSGVPLWTLTYGGASWDYGYSVQQTSDGGYIVAGTTSSFGNGYQVYLIKTNASGDTLWTRTYGGVYEDIGYSVQQTSDGGYIIAGETNSFGAGGYDVYLIKTNASGDTLWTRTYGGAYDGEGYSVRQTSDGGYIVVGTCDYSRYPHIYLIKTKASGDTLWTRFYGGITGQGSGYSVQQVSDGGYIITGDAYNDGNASYDAYLFKTNKYGDSLWTRTYGDTGTEYGYSVQQTSDLGYIIAGYTNSFGNDYQIYLIKTNAFGDTLWTKTYGGAGTDWGYSVQQTSDGGYIVSGTTSSFGNGYQVYLIKTDANGNVGVETKDKPLEGLKVGRFTATPNPFASFTRVLEHKGVRFSLYDVSGRKVGTYRGDRIGEGLSAGVYFLRSESGDAKPLRVVKVR